jgi:hypothetical protein
MERQRPFFRGSTARQGGKSSRSLPQLAYGVLLYQLACSQIGRGKWKEPVFTGVLLPTTAQVRWSTAFRIGRDLSAWLLA